MSRTILRALLAAVLALGLTAAPVAQSASSGSATLAGSLGCCKH